MIGFPVSISEWEQYIDDLDRGELRNQTINVNSYPFVQSLRGESFTMDEVQQVVRLFTRRMVQLEVPLPEGGAFDLVEIAEKDPLAFPL